jgi:hypothetical protein
VKLNAHLTFVQQINDRQEETQRKISKQNWVMGLSDKYYFSFCTVVISRIKENKVRHYLQERKKERKP